MNKIPMIFFIISKFILAFLYILADFVNDDTLIFLSYYYFLIDFCISFYYLHSKDLEVQNE